MAQTVDYMPAEIQPGFIITHAPTAPIRGSDGLLVMDSVSNPIRTSDHARSLAAGLLAGSKHLRQESMTTITRYAEAE